MHVDNVSVESCGSEAQTGEQRGQGETEDTEVEGKKGGIFVVPEEGKLSEIGAAGDLCLLSI